MHVNRTMRAALWHKHNEFTRKEGSGMYVTITLDGEPKEIADLVIAVQGQPSTEQRVATDSVIDSMYRRTAGSDESPTRS